MKKIIKTVWYNGNIGIVIYENEMNERKAVIGLGKSTMTSTNHDEESDAKHIADYGSKFPLELAEKL